MYRSHVWRSKLTNTSKSHFKNSSMILRGAEIEPCTKGSLKRNCRHFDGFVITGWFQWTHLMFYSIVQNTKFVTKNETDKNYIFNMNPTEVSVWHCRLRHHRVVLLTRSGRYMMTSPNGSIFRVTGPLWGEPPVTGGFPSQRPVTQSFGIFFDRRVNERLSKQPRSR